MNHAVGPIGEGERAASPVPELEGSQPRHRRSIPAARDKSATSQRWFAASPQRHNLCTSGETGPCGGWSRVRWQV